MEKDTISQQLALSENNKKNFDLKKSFPVTSPFATTVDTAKVLPLLY